MEMRLINNFVEEWGHENENTIAFIDWLARHPNASTLQEIAAFNVFRRKAIVELNAINNEP